MRTFVKGAIVLTVIITLVAAVTITADVYFEKKSHGNSSQAETTRTTTTTVTTVITTTTTTSSTSFSIPAPSTSTYTTATTSTTGSTPTATTAVTTTNSATTVASTPTPPPSTVCSSNTRNAFLYDNQFIYSPTLPVYAAGMLNNQFGVYKAYGYNNVTSTALWTAPQSSTPSGAYFAAQSDQNLVVYASNSAVLWAIGIYVTGLQAVFCLQMLDNGNLIWTNTTNSIIWQTNTAVSER